MKRIIVVTLMAIILLPVLAAEQEVLYRVNCPKCKSVEELKPERELNSGGRSLPNGNVMQEVTLYFKCDLRKCKEKFTSRIEREVTPVKAVPVKPKAEPVPSPKSK